MPQAQKPPVNSLRVTTSAAYGTKCPGRATDATDPLGSVTTTSWDDTCSFPLTITNGLGHRSTTRYYGVEDGLPPLEQKREGAHGTFHLVGRYGQVAADITPNGAMSLSSYDEWGRLAASWAPLDRIDRPGVRTEYRDASCERTGQEGFDDVACNRVDLPGLRVKSPPLVVTFKWDDQLPRCLTAAGKARVRGRAAERLPVARVLEATGEPTFGDGQMHMQGGER